MDEGQWAMSSDRFIRILIVGSRCCVLFVWLAFDNQSMSCLWVSVAGVSSEILGDVVQRHITDFLAT